MVDKLERTYVIPLRKHWRKAPIYKRSKRAINALRKFLVKHMKSDNVKIGLELNNLIFSHGFKHPPSKVQVTAIKEDGIVKVNLVGIPYKEATKEEKEKKAKEKVKEPEKLETPKELKEETKVVVKEKKEEDKSKKEVKKE